MIAASFSMVKYENCELAHTNMLVVLGSLYQSNEMT